MENDTKLALEFYIQKALNKLYKNDEYLIKIYSDKYNKDNHVSERGIVFRFGVYLEKYRLKYFPQYDLDVEYNRNINLIKMLNSKPVIPDLIIHKRGTNENNLLVLEFKACWNKDQTNDKKRIELFKQELNYQYGATILIAKTIKACKVDFI